MAYAPRGLAAVGLAALCLTAAASTASADTSFGVRYWSAWGDTGKTLYDFDGSTQLSRLTYSGLKSGATELYGRIGNGGIFLSGYAGLGSLNGGNLQDEDFPPGISPYSSTNSDQRDGKLNYATIDIGHYFWGGQNTRIGAFVGYNLFREVVSGYGCEQTATNPDVCVPTIDNSVKVITQTNNWRSVRLGVSGDVRLRRLTLGGDAALAYSTLSGTDAHWLRIGTDPGDFTGPVPEDGKGWGYQLEATLDYQLTNAWSVGVGARYWSMQARGDTHFENHIVGGGGGPQRVDWNTQMMGFTAQVAYHF